MAQHDYNLANQSGADFRADLNNALSAIATVNSGATEPSTTFAHQLWVDTSSNVLKIRNAANNDWITTGVSITASNTFTGNITGNVTGNADTATTLATARTINGVSFDGSANISFDTDSVSEGSSNLYFTNERVDDQVNTLLQAGTGIQLTYDDTAGTLTIANTNDADITGVVAGNGLTGGGTAGTVTLNVAVDDSSIEIDSDALRVKASGITNAMLAGSIANAKLSNSSVTINSNALSLGGTLTLDTDDIGEGSSNLYYTQARFDSAFTAKSTSDLSEGTNLYYTDTRFDTRLATKDTDNLSEGSSNLYYTDTRANAAIDARVTKSFVDALNIQAASVDANSVTLGTDTTGNYIQTITGTANKITVTGSGSESADVTLTLPDDVQVANNLTVAGNLTVNGTLTSLDTTNLDIEDNLFQLNAGLTGSPVNDSGMLINRGSSDNGIFMWDESVDKFTLGLTTADGTSTGNITLSSLGTLVANIEGNVTGNVTGTVSSLSNHDTGDLAEGSNLYYTDARVQAVSINNVVEDTTPQLGGDLASNGNNILFADSDKAIFGAGSDLQIFHDQSNSINYIKSFTSNELRLESNGNTTIRTNNGDDMAVFTKNGAATLYYDNASKLATTSTGVDVTGTITSDGLTVDNITIDGTEIDSNTDLTIDAAGDIALDADGGDFRFKDAGTTIATYSNVGGDWYITANSEDNDIVFQGNDGGSTVQALRLDMSDAGTAIFNNKVGIGTSSPARNLSINATSPVLQLCNSTTGTSAENGFELAVAGDTAYIMQREDANMIFGTNNTERMRIDSSGKVGISTTSPRVALDVNGEVAIAYNATYGLRFYNQPNNNWSSIGNTETSSAANLVFKDSTGEAMRIASGNLLVGKTSASSAVHGGEIRATGQVVASVDGSWAGLFNRETSDGEIIRLKQDDVTVGSIGNNGDNLGIESVDVGLLFLSGSGQIIPTGGNFGVSDATKDLGRTTTRFKDIHLRGSVYCDLVRGYEDTDTYVNFAGSNVLAFNTGASERARIDSSGNLGVGTSNPLNKFVVAEGTDQHGIEIAPGTLSYIQAYDRATSDYGDLTIDAQTIRFGTDNGAERMRIDTSGDLNMVNTGQASINYTTDGSTDYARITGGKSGSGVGDLRFFTYSGGIAERMRLDSSGNFLVGGTSLGQNNSFGVSQSGVIYSARESGTDMTHALFYNGSSIVGTIATTTSATQYNTSSDARLKDVTGEARGLEVINELNPVAYNWKADGKADEGLIAQEVLDIVPNAVSQNEEYYQMDYSKLVTPLIKAVQELSNEVNELKQEIQNLKGE
jgi:hypothetical protein